MGEAAPTVEDDVVLGLSLAADLANPSEPLDLDEASAQIVVRSFPRGGSRTPLTTD
jgi:hypothetical protein